MNRTPSTKPPDRRQRKSREAIQNALLVLLQDKPLDSITISELAIKADVNRKTFYNNYHNIQEVRDELDNRYLDSVFSLIEIDTLRSRPEEFFLKMFRSMHENIEQYRLLFDSGEHLCLYARLKENLQPYLKKEMERNERDARFLPYVITYTVNGLAALLDLWLHSSPMLPDEEIAKLAAELTRSASVSIHNA